MNYLLSFLITYTEDLILYLIAANYSGKFVLTVKQYIKMFLEITFLCFIIYVCLLWSSIFVTLLTVKIMFFTSVRIVLQKVFYNYYTNAVSHDCM